jgi:hypothetical protein
VWTLWQFSRVVSEFRNRADDDVWDAVIRRMALLMEHGIRTSMPVSEPLGDGLFALRARAGTKQPRLLYYFERDRRIVFVHAVDLKKRPKLDPDDVKVARRNKKIAEATEAFSEFTITH